MRGLVAAWFLCAPGAVWIAVFALAPLAFIVGASFLSRGDYGEIQPPWTFENYRRLAGWGDFGYDPLYPRLLLRTLLLSGGVTVLTLIASLPLAFFIAGKPPRKRALALALLVIPFWTNLLIRTYAWQLLLGARGPLASTAAWLGWIPAGSGLQPGWFAVVLTTFVDFLPFMALPVYASVEKIDWSLPEAAADLGAGTWQAFRHGILPQILPGIRAGAILVFLPATGQFVIPDLLGGGRTVLLGNLVQQQFGPSRDWPFGSAAATVGLLIFLAAWMLSRRSRTGEPTPAGW
jgi:spermidine/putrescine transport system permease protein